MAEKEVTMVTSIANHTGHDMVPIHKLVPHPRNPNKHPEEQLRLLAKLIDSTGWRHPIIVSNRSGFIISGHARLIVAEHMGWEVAPVNYQDWPNEAKEWADLIADNRIAELAEMDSPMLKDLLQDTDTGAMDMELTGYTEQAIEDLMTQLHQPTEGLTDDDHIPEVKDPVCKSGDLWKLGNHRLLCGDATKKEDAERLMGGEKADLVHADPPYGMGKEKDGIANDNLYGEKLDTFQMEWWRAIRPHLEDNGSAYIWGNAEGLWRLWYCGGLENSERLTHRNEITWDKGYQGYGLKSGGYRQYPSNSERCLFFMLGEQGFNNNADNYWDGWDGILHKLQADCKAMGWTQKDIKRICGVGMYAHWFTESQWELIGEEHYKKLQAEAKKVGEHDAFKREHDELKREHDELKREFYATRAYFDNTHDSMTDVWEFPRVTGEERHGHVTPKPVDMIARAIKSSCPNGGIAVDPFGGSGSTLIACEKLGRRCFMMEIDEHYCDVIIKRWEDFTGNNAVKCNDN